MSNDLLADEGAEQLVSTARAAAGDSLRSVTYFTRNDYVQVYLREDLEQDADLSSFIGTEWRGFEITESVYGSSELGEYQYTLRGFENGYLLRVTTDSEGVFITTDGLTLVDFESVATALSELLADWDATETPASE
jgi:hypothetical protein